MAEIPRRRALLAAASGIAALAGCSGSESASNSVPRGERPVDDYELVRARDGTGGALVTSGDTLPSLSVDERARQQRGTRRVLVTEDDLSALTFAETEPARTLRSFLAETDFDAASAYLLSMPVEACREIRFRSVSVESDELAHDDLHPHARFCQTYRPADVECDVGDVHTVGFAIRLPVAADHSRGSGRGMRSTCRDRNPPSVFGEADGNGTGGDDA